MKRPYKYFTIIPFSRKEKKSFTVVSSFGDGL
jgi:hypothetical protein